MEIAKQQHWRSLGTDIQAVVITADPRGLMHMMSFLQKAQNNTTILNPARLKLLEDLLTLPKDSIRTLIDAYYKRKAHDNRILVTPDQLLSLGPFGMLAGIYGKTFEKEAQHIFNSVYSFTTAPTSEDTDQKPPEKPEQKEPEPKPKTKTDAKPKKNQPEPKPKKTKDTTLRPRSSVWRKTTRGTTTRGTTRSTRYHPRVEPLTPTTSATTSGYNPQVQQPTTTIIQPSIDLLYPEIDPNFFDPNLSTRSMN
ncbi:MAG: hypothetical protein GY696_34085 [Gammaproteobacteria bacterium]|nr:hypothetical protein [Gammaproteobacteria bacterium]